MQMMKYGLYFYSKNKVSWNFFVVTSLHGFITLSHLDNSIK